MQTEGSNALWVMYQDNYYKASTICKRVPVMNNAIYKVTNAVFFLAEIKRI